MRLPVILGVIIAAALARAWAAQSFVAEPTREQTEFFEQKIRPVLADRCYKCHSAEADKIKGGLLLDTREGVIRGGESGAMIVPGDPDKSLLIQALRYTDESLKMPPKEMLSTNQIADFAAWVRMGAPDPRAEKTARTYRVTTNSWAFRAPELPPIPKVKNKKWASQPIDAFILARLEQKKLLPAKSADKRTLIRRASFDLTGLPPKPEQVEAFLRDSSPEAFAKVVDQMLDSRQYGENWGRHWLDVARYADSNGLENNVLLTNAWRYRDYVIKAFNSDKPFDEFAREQIAGDLLPANSETNKHEKLIATGYLVLGPKSLNDPEQEKVLMDVADEQIDVTMRGFNALTVSCARCHDHKFDPIPTRDYYALAGIFRSTRTLAAGRQNPGVFWHERMLAPRGVAEEFEAYEAKVAQMQADLTAARQMNRTFAGGMNSKTMAGIVVDNTDAQITGTWKPSNYSTNFVDANYLQDGNDKNNKGKNSARFVPMLPKSGRYEVRVSYTPSWNRATNVPVRIESAEGVKTVSINQRLAPTFDKAFTSVGVFDFAAGTNGAVIISNAGTTGFVVVDAVQFLPAESMTMMASETPAARPKPVKLLSMVEQEELDDKLQELQSKAPPDLPRAMAVQDGSVQNCRINIRGDTQKLGEEVPRGFLGILGGFRLESQSDSGRLELANWIASRRNPLTARVMANRIWHHLFGRGLVPSTDNFGALGDLPIHPELLDYLAIQFMNDGWSCKKLIRSIMLSSAYQMSSEMNADAYGKDPDNRYLWRMSRRRLPAESIHDALLLVSGQLDESSGGPAFSGGVNPMPNPAGRPAQVQPSYRRAVYQPTLRNNVPEILQIFDFVDPHVLNGKRHITTVATQSLFMMNSPYVIDLAKRWSQKLASAPGSDQTRVSKAYEEAFGRPPSRDETQRALRYVADFSAEIDPGSTDSVRDRAWRSFCHALLASSEFRFLN